jgi:4-amino-4-deoxy-L-arabinose transferase-like glycosyltransferase
VRRPVLTLVLLSFLTFLVGLGRQAITDSDEAFYAEAAREMVESGDWLTPHFNYEERWQKPVLYYWATALIYLIAGPTEWAARFWSAFSGLGLVLLSWRMARRLTASDDAAWLAGGIVATCFGCFAMARLALPDLPLAFFMTLTIWSALEERWLVAGAAAGFGFLMKGPVALAIPAVVLIPIWWHERQLTRGRLREVGLAAAAFALIGLPWYAAMTAVHGVAYLDSFFVGDNLERFATDRFNDPRPIWFYVPIVIGGMLPWSMYLLILPRQPLRDVFRRARRLAIEEWRLLAWAFMPLFFFTLSVGKQPRYILPALPPLAILLARSITRHTAEDDTPARFDLAASVWATVTLFVVLAILLFRAEPLIMTAYPFLTYIGIALIAACSLALGWLAVSRRWQMLPLVMTVCAAVLLLSVQFGALAGRRPEPVEQMAAFIHTHRTSGEPVGAYQVFVRNLVFYTRFKQIELFDEGRALDFVKSPERVLLVVRAVDLPRLETISGITTKRLGAVQYLNTANVRLRTLISPIPAQDLETVLLVANR